MVESSSNFGLSRLQNGTENGSNPLIENPAASIRATTSSGDRDLQSKDQSSTVAKSSVDNRQRPKNVNRSHSGFDTRKLPSPDSPTYTAVQELLKDEGVIKWDRNVSQQVQTFMIQLSSQLLDHAKSSAEHRDSNSVSAEDLNEALDSFNKSFKTDRINAETRLKESADRLNKELLPKIRSEYGIHMPNERFMVIQPDYQSNEDIRRQTNLGQMGNNSHLLVGRHAVSNAYSSNIVEQSFNNNNLTEDPSEFD